MNTMETMLLLGAGAALLFGMKQDGATDKQNANTSAWAAPAAITATRAPEKEIVVVRSVNPITHTETASYVATPAQGVAAINQAVNTGKLLQPTGETLAVVQVTPTETHGVEVINGKKTLLTVKPATRDVVGLSAMDKLILKNKGLPQTVDAARAEGLL